MPRYHGATTDWNQQEPGWSSPGFTPSAAWGAASWLASPQTLGPLRSEALPTVAALRTVQPTAVHTNPDGSLVFAFPENLVGVVRIAPLPDAPAGTVITLTHGEYLSEGGSESSVQFVDHATRADGGSNDKSKMTEPPLNARFINAVNLGIWFQSAPNLRHHVTSCSMCGYNLCSPSPTSWGVELTDAEMLAIAASPVDFDCSMCNASCFEKNKPAPGPWQRLANTFGQIDSHTLRPGYADAMTPLFTWHGFQYVQVRGD